MPNNDLATEFRRTVSGLLEIYDYKHLGDKDGSSVRIPKEDERNLKTLTAKLGCRTTNPALTGKTTGNWQYFLKDTGAFPHLLSVYYGTSQIDRDNTIVHVTAQLGPFLGMVVGPRILGFKPSLRGWVHTDLHTNGYTEGSLPDAKVSDIGPANKEAYNLASLLLRELKIR